MQQVVCKCTVLLGAGEEGPGCRLVRKFLFRFCHRLMKLKNWHICPQSASLAALKWSLHWRNGRAQVSCWGSILLFFIVFLSKRLGFFFSIKCNVTQIRFLMGIPSGRPPNLQFSLAVLRKRRCLSYEFGCSPRPG